MSNSIQKLIEEANAKWNAKVESVLNQTFEMKPFNGGEKYQIKVLSVNDKGFCICESTSLKGTIRVSIDWVLKGKKI